MKSVARQEKHPAVSVNDPDVPVVAKSKNPANPAIEFSSPDSDQSSMMWTYNVWANEYLSDVNTTVDRFYELQGGLFVINQIPIDISQTTRGHLKRQAETVWDVVRILHASSRTVEPDYFNDAFWDEFQKLLAHGIDLDLLLIDSQANKQQIDLAANKILFMLDIYLGSAEARVIDTILMLKVPFGTLNTCQVNVFGMVARALIQRRFNVVSSKNKVYLQKLLLAKWWSSLPGCSSDEIKKYLTCLVPPGFQQEYKIRLPAFSRGVQFGVTEYLLDNMNDIQTEIQRYNYCMLQPDYYFASTWDPQEDVNSLPSQEWTKKTKFTVNSVCFHCALYLLACTILLRYFLSILFGFVL